MSLDGAVTTFGGFCVAKDDLRRRRLDERDAPGADLAPGHMLVDRDAGYDRAHADEHLVLRPLFSLSFFCAEFLKEERGFGARQVFISSASSKAALGMAFLLSMARRAGEVEIVGLTSAANADFVTERRAYDRVVAYRTVSSLPAEPAVFFDIAGDGSVRAAVHHHLQDAVKHSLHVGSTHRDALGAVEPGLPRPAPQLFFTPDHILKRRRECGAEALGACLSETWRAFLGYVKPWLLSSIRPALPA